MKLTQASNTGYAVYKCLSYHVTFGYGHDLYISNLASTNANSRTRPNTYSPPEGCSLGAACTLFAGSYYFTPDDIEVFFLSVS